MVSDYVRERFSAVSRETRESERAEAGAGGPEHARLDRGRGSRATDLSLTPQQRRSLDSSGRALCTTAHRASGATSARGTQSGGWLFGGRR